MPLLTVAELHSQFANCLHSTFTSLYHGNTRKYRAAKLRIFVKIRPLLPEYCQTGGTYCLNFRENSWLNNDLSVLQADAKPATTAQWWLLGPRNSQLPDLNSQLRVCQPCVNLCHPFKRCTPFIYRGCVSVSALFSKFLVYWTLYWYFHLLFCTFERCTLEGRQHLENKNITFSLSVPLSCLGIPLLLLVRLQIYTFGFAACKQELILNTPNSSKENDQENRPRDLR
jgi:hypothetical protein